MATEFEFRRHQNSLLGDRCDGLFARLTIALSDVATEDDAARSATESPGGKSMSGKLVR
ncbi:hypothetical protein AB4Z52_25660 [Rhizobium sp. 2YAF20]|uniref:hypothetical protein n=1 Tax=Rhizobium sp. 2YAF20 TaxID=3233027 RepID=UPI003F9E27E3